MCLFSLHIGDACSIEAAGRIRLASLEYGERRRIRFKGTVSYSGKMPIPFPAETGEAIDALTCTVNARLQLA